MPKLGLNVDLLSKLISLRGPCPEICDGTIPLGGPNGTSTVNIKTGLEVCIDNIISNNITTLEIPLEIIYDPGFDDPSQWILPTEISAVWVFSGGNLVVYAKINGGDPNRGLYNLGLSSWVDTNVFGVDPINNIIVKYEIITGNGNGNLRCLLLDIFGPNLIDNVIVPPNTTYSGTCLFDVVDPFNYDYVFNFLLDPNIDGNFIEIISFRMVVISFQSNNQQSPPSPCCECN